LPAPRSEDLTQAAVRREAVKRLAKGDSSNAPRSSDFGRRDALSPAATILNLGAIRQQDQHDLPQWYTD